jgi:hypothetical protein
MPQHPLAEVFGYPTDNFSEEAQRHRKSRLCPYHNQVPHCTYDQTLDPLGVCSIFDRAGNPIITCPTRFRERWLVAVHAAEFFFPHGATWTSLTGVRLNDAQGHRVGNIDLVLAAHDKVTGRLLDFGAVEFQGVDISGDARLLVEQYLADPHATYDDAVGPDYLAANQRLAARLAAKGPILKAWGKKQAIAVHKHFWSSRPEPSTTTAEQADIAWLIYDFMPDRQANRYQLALVQTVYTPFPSFEEAAITAPGPVEDFIETLAWQIDRLGGCKT